jgi:hypothetical protein
MKTLLLLAAMLTPSLALAAEIVPPGPQYIRNARPHSLESLKNGAIRIQIANELAARNARQPMSLANQQALYVAHHAGFAPTSYRQLSSWSRDTKLGTMQPAARRK